jgi:hypothetical protein
MKTSYFWNITKEFDLWDTPCILKCIKSDIRADILMIILYQQEINDFILVAAEEELKNLISDAWKIILNKMY